MTKNGILFDNDGTPMIPYNNSRCVENGDEIVVDLRRTPVGYNALFVYDPDTDEWEEHEVFRD